MQAYAAAAANISVAIMFYVTWALILAISDASACCWAAPKAVVCLWCGGGGEDMHVVQLCPVEPSPICNFRVCAMISADVAAARWRLGLALAAGAWVCLVPQICVQEFSSSCSRPTKTFHKLKVVAFALHEPPATAHSAATVDHTDQLLANPGCLIVAQQVLLKSNLLCTWWNCRSSARIACTR